jgi:transposase
MFVRAKKRGQWTYLMVVENRWVDGRVRQTVLHSLGRLDVLVATGKLDGLIVSAARFSEKLAVLGADARGQALRTRKRTIGPALMFERLWGDLGIGDVLEELLSDRRFEFSVERAVFVTVLHRLFDPGSDRAAEKWKEDYAIGGADDLPLHHLYRAMAWLGTALPPDEQGGATPFAPRCWKDRVEEELFARRRDLLSSLDVVFFDTTSMYFEGEGGESLGQYGHSKDHRSDLKQVVVGMVLDNEGTPICSQMWPGNTADVKSLVPVVDRLRRHFAINEVCIVADRGMISQKTMADLEERQWKYILGARMRKCKEVAGEVLNRPGRYEVVFPKNPIKKNPSPLKVKEVHVGDRRYVVCLNEDQAAKDRHDREAIVAALSDALKQGDKSLIGNRGFRRFVRTVGERFTIDTEKIKEEERYDGKWVLTSNMALSAGDLALKYKQLWTVEDVFRSMKSVLVTRPIYHKTDETIRGHVFCSFLALLLRKELQDRLERKGWHLQWADIVRDLDNLVEMQLTVQGKGYVLRSETNGTVGKVAQACAIALPPTLRALQQPT